MISGKNNYSLVSEDTRKSQDRRDFVRVVMETRQTVLGSQAKYLGIKCERKCYQGRYSSIFSRSKGRKGTTM